MNLLVVLNEGHKSVLDPLLWSWRRQGHLVCFKYYEGKEVPAPGVIEHAAGGSDAVMLLVPGTRQAYALAGNTLLQIGSRKVPLSLIPAPDNEVLACFVAAAISEDVPDAVPVPEEMQHPLAYT